VTGAPARIGEIDTWVCIEPGHDTDATVHRVLGRYPGLEDAAVRHARDGHGRLSVRGRDDLHLSVSHTAGVTLVAVGLGCRVGIDVEPAGKRGLRRLRYHVLTGAELADLERHDPPAQTEVLLGYWTRKEALLKAVGAGLAIEPRLIELPPAGTSRHPVAVPRALGRPEAWTVVSLRLDGYVAAVAADAPDPRVRVLPLDETA
jgi:4'-phosphopantetheinyl transferase